MKTNFVQSEGYVMKLAIVPLVIILTLLLSCKEQETQKKQEEPSNTLTDPRDGRIYKTVTIGNQVWMAENLAFKADNGSWPYYNDERNVEYYGYLYFWEAACKVCPEGWHLPSELEWEKLEAALGMFRSESGYIDGNPIGTKLKSPIGWGYGGNGTNESGFNALPGGYVTHDYFFDLGKRGFWWTSTEYDSFMAFIRELNSDQNDLTRNAVSKYNALSVRCVKN